MVFELLNITFLLLKQLALSLSLQLLTLEIGLYLHLVETGRNSHAGLKKTQIVTCLLSLLDRELTWELDSQYVPLLENSV